MRILVTGGSGFIGCNLIRFLLDKFDHKVLNLDKLTYAANPTALDHFKDSEQYLFQKLDLADEPHRLQEILKQFKPERIIHLAAESHVDRSIDGPAAFIQSNIVGTFNLLEASRQCLSSAESNNASFALVHVSTDEVYGSLSSTDPAFEITSRYQPQSPYSASKASSDHLVRAWQNTFGLPTIVATCSNNFGPFQHLEKLIPKVITQAVQGQPIPLYGDGANIRDWIYVDDCVEAISAVVSRGQPGKTYHLGSNNEISNIELVHQLCDRLDKLVPGCENENVKNADARFSYRDLITWVQDRPGHDFRYSLGTSETEKLLGWQAKHEFSSALATTVDWYLNNG